MVSEIYIFKSPGIAAMIMHQSKAVSIFKLSYSFEGEDNNLEKYHPLDKESSFDTCSQTLMDLLSLISPKLNKTLPASLIGNMVTSTCTSRASMVQVALGLLFRERRIIDHILI